MGLGKTIEVLGLILVNQRDQKSNLDIWGPYNPEVKIVKSNLIGNSSSKPKISQQAPSYSPNTFHSQTQTTPMQSRSSASITRSSSFPFTPSFSKDQLSNFKINLNTSNNNINNRNTNTNFNHNNNSAPKNINNNINTNNTNNIDCSIQNNPLPFNSSSWENLFDSKSTLIVAPKILVEQWRTEIQKHTQGIRVTFQFSTLILV